MSSRNIALTGIPRSGTTLCCNLLGQAADTVALFEPMPVHQLPVDHALAADVIADYFAQSRRELLEGGTASSQQVGGLVPDNPFGNERDASGQRVRQAHLGKITVDKPLSPQFTLVIKHNAAFTALLDVLALRFDCYAVIRNPLSVLASWNSVALPVASGRLPAGERLDPALAARLDEEPDVLERQLLLLDWLFARFGKMVPDERIIRYEEVVGSQGAALARITGVAVPPLPLRSRNSSALYDVQACARYAERLLAHPGPWRGFYQPDDVMAALAELQERA